MNKKEESEYSIEQFTLDKSNIEEYSKLITAAFLADAAAQVEGASIIFTEQTFRTIFGGPSIDNDFFIRAIHKPTNELVGFFGLIPRKLAINKKVYKSAIPSWISVRSDHQRQGLAKLMGKKMLEMGLAADYDCGFALFEPEQRGIDTAEAVARETNIPMKRAFYLTKYIIRVFDANKTTSAVKVKWYEKLVFKLLQSVKEPKNLSVRRYHKNDIDQIFELMGDFAERNQISIVPNYEDLKWMLSNPNVVCVVHENDASKIDGFIFAWEFVLAGFGNQTTFGWLDAVHIHRLSSKDATDLAKGLCFEAKKSGWAGIQTPYIPYFDSKPLKKAKFIFFPKRLSLDLFNLKNIDLPEDIESVYVEWR
ncbi:MAG: GNAT family N-acetyltransferase [Candidatus Heimdallarchaeota archaeon]|nr:GNAT family N-acetyltransferase [Candidatus Heimdallarchaeota archaeon]MCK4877268.1 GNAT family N-acetyltransferase [Candidatus Heimdallarchaeota archaeon]